jgi:pimeloyl-ACP methyl ester carboxylesterase
MMSHIEEEIQLDGFTLHLSHTLGEPGRPTLVFLHDSLGCTVLWRDFPAALGEATGCPTLVYDRQGYGQSGPFGCARREMTYLETEADVLQRLLERCGIEQAILFGHSDGGSIALLAAAKHPARILAVATEGAHIFVEEVTLRGIREAVQAYDSTNLPERLRKYHGDKTDAVFQAWAQTWLCDDYRTWNIESFLPQITCPILVIQGGQDEYGTLAQVTGIVEQVVGAAQPLLIPFVGHTPHKDARPTVVHYTSLFIEMVIQGSFASPKHC